ncbi:MAG: hypothetical protein O7A69_00580 [SAR324 cluster bacterium]|nr:hypothetical protein [SAR324 cluster bacterium]
MRARLLLRCLAAAALGVVIPFTLQAQDRLEVLKMVLAEPEILPGGEQLVQISLRNNSGSTASAGLRVEIHTTDNFRTGKRGQRAVALPAGTVRRVFFRLKAPDTPGQYTVRLRVMTADFKRNLLAGKPAFSSRFIVAGASVTPQVVLPRESGGPTQPGRSAASFRTTGGLRFERPDLLWENFLVEPQQLLIGESVRIKGELRNIGGDIARNITIRADYVDTRLPTRLHPVSSSTVDVLAPGEKLEMEFEFRFPNDALQGDYQFMLTADVTQKVAESNEKNNRQTTDRPIRLSKILQIFPEAGFTFDQSGLFLFRWKSTIYNEFKVQVGTQKSFEKKESFFDIPQGEKWATGNEIVPLPGELPGMLLGLMVKDYADKVFWRVMGRVADTNKVGFSRSLPFQISVAEEVPPVQGGASASPEPPKGKLKY